MNDVHMSHSMEFPYPQSMANCATCHAGKLDTVLSDANFKVETCKSCHPVTGAVGPVKEGQTEPSYDTTKLALKTIMPAAIHESMDLNTADCASCHSEGKTGKTFKQIHSGYDKAIYTADGLSTLKASPSPSTVPPLTAAPSTSSSAPREIQALERIDTSTITPTVMVGLYG